MERANGKEKWRGKMERKNGKENLHKHKTKLKRVNNFFDGKEDTEMNKKCERYLDVRSKDS